MGNGFHHSVRLIKPNGKSEWFKATDNICGIVLENMSPLEHYVPAGQIQINGLEITVEKAREKSIVAKDNNKQDCLYWRHIQCLNKAKRKHILNWYVRDVIGEENWRALHR